MAYYSNRLSYQEVEDLVERVSGERLLSDQKIWDIVVNKAVEVSSNWQQEIEEINQEITSEVQISPTVDIYDPEAAEIFLFDDAIGVKKQKENRERNQELVIELASRGKIEETNSSEPKKSRKTVLTDLVLLQTPKGHFEYVTTPIDEQGKPLIPLEKIIKSKLNYHYQHARYPLPIVAITDGASNIRLSFEST